MSSIVAFAVVVIFGLARSVFALLRDTLAAAAVPADSISKYTYDFFLNNTKTPPAPSGCVFYTSTLTSNAEAFASREAKSTIWSVWDFSLYDRDQADTNPLRDILGPVSVGSPNLADTQTYFEHMSGAYAALCSGTATLLSTSPDNVDMSGIWGQIEFARLQKTGNPGGQVDRVDACDQDGDNCVDPPFWTRTIPKKLEHSADVSRAVVNEPELEKRQIGDRSEFAALPRNFTPEELDRIFSDIDKLW